MSKQDPADDLGDMCLACGSDYCCGGMPWLARAWKALASKKLRIIRGLDIEINGAMNDYASAKERASKATLRIIALEAAIERYQARLQSIVNEGTPEAAVHAERALGMLAEELRK